MVNLSNDKSISRKSIPEFSSDRLLIADNIIAEKLGKEMLFEVCNHDIKSRTISIVLQPLEPGFGVIYPVERMIYQDFVCMIGGNECYLEESTERLTKDMLQQKINMYT